MRGKVTVVGSSNTDMIVQVPHLPAPGETVLGGAFSSVCGGKGANQAVAAARAGAETVFIARLGRDAFGDATIDNLHTEGIDTRFIVRDPDAPSGVAMIVVDEAGENSIAVAPGANAKLCPADIDNAREAIAASDCVVIQLEIPIESVEYAAQIAFESGARVILNPAPARDLSNELLRRVFLLTPNESEASFLAGIDVVNQDTAVAAVDRLMERGVDGVVITLGKRGAVFKSRNVPFGLAEAFEVKALDTTAAGDVFNGALAVGLAEGRRLRDAVAFANAAAACSVTKLGAQPSAPERERILELMQARA